MSPSFKHLEHQDTHIPSLSGIKGEVQNAKRIYYAYIMPY